MLGLVVPAYIDSKYVGGSAKSLGLQRRLFELGFITADQCQCYAFAPKFERDRFAQSATGSCDQGYTML